MNYDQEPASQKTNWIIPIAIILAGALVAFSLYIIKRPNPSATAAATSSHSEDNMVPVGLTDHIQGNISAPVTIVEYADTDCPFCKEYNNTLHQIMNTYTHGEVAWVYRHFAFHPNAPKEAEATECAAKLGGNDKFWQYLDLVFSKKDFTKTPYVGLDPKELPVLAGSIGLDKAAFNDCLGSGQFTQKIADDYQNAVKAGAEGTPYSILVTHAGKIAITSGAVPFTSLKSAIDTLLKP